jgi:hypothetical protein
MRLLLFISILSLAAPGSAQDAPDAASPPAQPPAAVASPAPVAQPVVWDPAAAYITAGQDIDGYKSWYLAGPWREGQVRSFNAYLESAGVLGVVPTWQLFRTATSWQACNGQPFEIPPSSEWPHIIQTLRYIRDYVIPAVGPVEAVSVYRNPSLNQCAGGAPESAHKHDSAIDMVPLKQITREDLIKILCGDHTKNGARYGAGLGFYAFLRFHVDSMKFRRWNMDPAVLALCPPIVQPADVASVGQPAPDASSTTPPASPPDAKGERAAASPSQAIPGQQHR